MGKILEKSAAYEVNAETFNKNCIPKIYVFKTNTKLNSYPSKFPSFLNPESTKTNTTELTKFER